MIHGVGVDVVHIAAFAEQLNDAASTFEAGTFTPGERAEARSRPGGVTHRHLAARFAAKEAFIKAWSGGFFNQIPRLPRVDLREIEVVSDAWGRPSLRLHGALAEAVGAGLRPHVSLSHDGDVALAQVVLERVRGAGDEGAGEGLGC